MADPVEFDGVNIMFGPPRGQEGRVAQMPAFTNGKCVVTRWRLTEEELESVKETGCIYLCSLSGKSVHPTFVGSEFGVRGMAADYGGTFPRHKEKTTQ